MEYDNNHFIIASRAYSLQGFHPNYDCHRSRHNPVKFCHGAPILVKYCQSLTSHQFWARLGQHMDPVRREEGFLPNYYCHRSWHNPTKFCHYAPILVKYCQSLMSRVISSKIGTTSRPREECLILVVVELHRCATLTSTSQGASSWRWCTTFVAMTGRGCPSDAHVHGHDRGWRRRGDKKNLIFTRVRKQSTLSQNKKLATL
jgi:hypothetical protein